MCNEKLNEFKKATKVFQQQILEVKEKQTFL